MNDFSQTDTIIRHFFTLRERATKTGDISGLTDSIEKLFALLNESDSYADFKGKYMTHFWDEIKVEMRKIISNIEGYNIDEDTGILILKTKSGEIIEEPLLLPEDIVAFYLDVPQEFDNFGSIYFHQSEENILAQLYHAGLMNELNK